MLFGHWRGVTFSVALSIALAAGFASHASAGLFHRTIPPDSAAYNVNTGGPIEAPPVPYGEYAKDYAGCIHSAVGCLSCRAHGLLGGGACNDGGGACGPCWGRGLFHGGGRSCGNFGGFGHGVCASSQIVPSSQSCGSCGGAGCGLCRGGLFHGRGCGYCGGAGCGMCRGAGCGLGGGHVLGYLGALLDPHAGKVQYFVGAGGPVPLTPGYVPYVVPTRSPRDFFAFPPFSPDAP